MTKDEALRLALEALKQIDEAMPFPVAKLAQKVIKEALAQTEPVAWEQFYPEMGSPKLAYLSPTESPDNACYTPPQRTWVGMTDEDFYGQSELQVMAMKYAEAKLKDKNARR